MTDHEFTEGKRYELSDLPDSDMTASGKLEAVGDGKLAARFGEIYVTFEWATVECTDVTPVEEIKQ